MTYRLKFTALSRDFWIKRLTLCAVVTSSMCACESNTPLKTVIETSNSSSSYIQDWKSRRDYWVVKQSFDQSCGAAAMATVLNFYYRQNVIEDQLLKAMENTGKKEVSFAQMQNILPDFGFRAVGYAAQYEQLMQLKIPVIVYLKVKNIDHFSVLRSVDARGVWLADSAVGNWYLNKTQFMALWAMSVADSEHSVDSTQTVKGRFLAITPQNPPTAANDEFFTKTFLPRVFTLKNSHLLKYWHIK